MDSWDGGVTIVSTNWNEWHAAYDDPRSSLSRRLEVVRQRFAAILDRGGPVSTRVLSVCAGDGRDVLPVLARCHASASAVLVELDSTLASAARRTAAELGLASVEVRTADAGQLDTYAGMPPANIVLACGVFGNITDADDRSTIRTLPQLLAANGSVIWTRGDRLQGDPADHDGDPADMVREVFAEHDFVEEVFVRPDDVRFRVGVHRFTGTPQHRATGTTMFTFVR
jgi:Methyltransferase domain